MTFPNTFDRTWINPGFFKAAQAVVNTLDAHNFEAYFAGGCVRDTFLRRQVKDIDIVTSARPEDIQRLFPKNRPVGAHFGVVLVHHGEHVFEVATFRTDLSYSDGRRPNGVLFTCPLEDARRRDFTINGLFYDPLRDLLIDHVGGFDDLKKGLVRAIGDPELRFEEDHLRLLRAVRFASALNFSIEPETWNSIIRTTPFITRVSQERIQAETVRMLTDSGADQALGMLLDSGIMREIIPEACAMAGVPQPAEFHPEGDVFQHVQLMYRYVRPPLCEALAWAILCHDIGKPATFRLRDRIRFSGHAEVGTLITHDLLTRLKCSRETIQVASDLVKHHLHFMNVHRMRPSTLKKFLRMDHFDLHLELHRVDCLASHGLLGHFEFCQEKLNEFEPDKLRPLLLLSGHDLITMGFRPGPIFSEILQDVENRQLENLLVNADDARQYVIEKYKP